MIKIRGGEYLDKLISLGLLAFGVVCAVLILTVKKSASGDGHDHGGGHDAGGAEEAASASGEAAHVEGSESIALDDDQVSTAGIELLNAAAGTVRSLLRVRGQVAVNRDQTAEIAPRFGGIVTRSYKKLGDRVRRGDTLASVESAATRAAIEVRSGIDGVVTSVRVGAGGYASDKEPLFVVTDLNRVWAEFLVPDGDAAFVKAGQSVSLRETMGTASATATITFVSPLVDEDTQSLLVRAVLENADAKWRPGAFIEGEIALGELAAPVTVHRSAVHELKGADVVFVRHADGDAFGIRQVELGRADKELVEVKKGLAAGENYAAANSYLVKAELLKSEAGHGH